MNGISWEMYRIYAEVTRFKYQLHSRFQAEDAEASLLEP